MSLNLHADCKKRLIEVIAEQLPKITVSKNMFLDRKSTMHLFLAESVIPDKGEVKHKLEEFVDEAPVYEFIYETLARELSENLEYNREIQDQSLVAITGYEDPDATATRLVEELDSLPWKYIFTVQFHKELSENSISKIKVLKHDEQLGISKIDDDFMKKYSLKSSISGSKSGNARQGIASALLFGSFDEWAHDSLCFQIEHEGFVGYYGESSTFEKAKNDFKAFCGLSIALRLFKVEYKYKSTPQKAKFFIHKFIDSEWVFQRSQDLDADVSEAFHDLILHDLDGKLDTEDKQISWINPILIQIKMTFDHREKAKNILLASEWLFDSYSSKNKLLAFIQMTVVLEILLGDKASSDQVGLSVLLRNRCAYLIGDTKSERESIIDYFQQIYDVRSRIVHGGKSRLNAKEFNLFLRLQWMCRRIIQKEIKLLIKDLQKAN